jgi:hypothetical protein
VTISKQDAVRFIYVLVFQKNFKKPTFGLLKFLPRWVLIALRAKIAIKKGHFQAIYGRK